MDRDRLLKNWTRPASRQAWQAERDALAQKTTLFEITEFKEDSTWGIGFGFFLAGIMLKIQENNPYHPHTVSWIWWAMIGLGILACILYHPYRKWQIEKFLNNPDQVRFALLREREMDPSLRDEMSKSRALWDDYIAFRHTHPDFFLDGDELTLLHRHNTPYIRVGLFFGMIMAAVIPMMLVGFATVAQGN